MVSAYERFFLLQFRWTTTFSLACGEGIWANLSATATADNLPALMDPC